MSVIEHPKVTHSRLLEARRQVRIARVDFYLAKTKLIRAMREAEDLMYPPKPGRKQAG